MISAASHVAQCRSRIRAAKRVNMWMLGADSGPYEARISKADAHRIVGEGGFDVSLSLYPDGVAILQPGISMDDCDCCEDE